MKPSELRLFREQAPVWIPALPQVRAPPPVWIQVQAWFQAQVRASTPVRAPAQERVQLLASPAEAPARSFQQRAGVPPRLRRQEQQVQ